MRLLRSLSNRIFLASALLAALSIGAAVFFVRGRLTTETQAALDRDLRTAAALADQQQAAVFETFTRSARLLADLPRFKAAVDTGDAPTVQPIAEDYLEQIGADVLRVRDQRGALLASVDRDVVGVLREVEVPILVDQDRPGHALGGLRTRREARHRAWRAHRSRDRLCVRGPRPGIDARGRGAGCPGRRSSKAPRAR